MRHHLLFLGIVAGIIGCGGSGGNSGSGGPSNAELQFQTRMLEASKTSIRLLERKGDVSLGLQATQPTGGASWSVPRFDEARGVWRTRTFAQSTPNGPDGLPGTFLTEIREEYMDEAGAAYGYRTERIHQVDFYGTETDTGREFHTAGPLAGYAYVRDLVTDMGTMEVTGTVRSKFTSRWGEFLTTYGAYGFTTRHTKKGKIDNWVWQSETEPMVGTMYDGSKVEILEGNDVRTTGVGSGRILNAAGSEVAQLSWDGSELTIRWSPTRIVTSNIWQ